MNGIKANVIILIIREDVLYYKYYIHVLYNTAEVMFIVMVHVC